MSHSSQLGPGVSVYMCFSPTPLFLSLQALINILRQKGVDTDPENVIGYLRPFRIIISLLDKPEIGRHH